MPDEGRRRVEREWAGGDPAAEARHLLERVRSGDLQRDRLELAAYAGHPAALLALEKDSPPDAEAVGPWVLALGKWGDDVIDCAEGAAVQVALEGLRASPDATHQALVLNYEEFFGAGPDASLEALADSGLLATAAESPDSASSAADVCGWFLVSRTLFAREHVPAAFLRSTADHVAALTAALGRSVLAEIREQVIAFALR